MPTPATQDLIERLKAGDRVAQNSWFAQHLEHLTRWINCSVGVSPGHGGGASDVMQNVAKEVLRGIPQHVDTEVTLLQWVRTKLRQRAIDLVRKRVLLTLSSSLSESASEGADPAGLVVGTVTTPSLQAIRKEREDYILSVLVEDDHPLQPLDTGTVIVLLRQIDEVPLKVIADRLQIECVKVAKEYHEALRPVRTKLDQLTVGNWPPEQDTDREKLCRALLQLTDQQRHVVGLCHLEQNAYPVFNRATKKYEELDCRYSLREAGAVLDVEAGAVGGCVYRAMKKLEELLNPTKPV